MNVLLSCEVKIKRAQGVLIHYTEPW